MHNGVLHQVGARLRFKDGPAGQHFLQLKPQRPPVRHRLCHELFEVCQQTLILHALFTLAGHIAHSSHPIAQTHAPTLLTLIAAALLNSFLQQQHKGHIKLDSHPDST